MLSRKSKLNPDPPSRHHPPSLKSYGGTSLLCCLRSLLPAAYDLYASVGAPQRPRSKPGTFDLHLTPCWCPGLLQNPLLLLIKEKFDGGFWLKDLNP